VAGLNTSKSSLQNLYTALISVSNGSQNFFLPPWVFSSMVNTATSFLIDKCVALYPDNAQLLDIIAPFVQVVCIPPSGGLISLPLNYRNILGAPSVIVNKTGECGEVVVPITTAQQFLTATLKGGCERRPIAIVPQSEFDYLTTSAYKKPTYWDPAGFNTGQNAETGQVQIRICPADLSKVFVLYVRQELVYSLGYVMNPDDTWYISAATTVDTEWGTTAFQPLFKALNHLFGIYARDKQFSDWAQALSQISIV
jgi:hypothetical protein